MSSVQIDKDLHGSSYLILFCSSEEDKMFHIYFFLTASLLSGKSQAFNPNMLMLRYDQDITTFNSAQCLASQEKPRRAQTGDRAGGGADLGPGTTWIHQVCTPVSVVHSHWSRANDDWLSLVEMVLYGIGGPAEQFLESNLDIEWRTQTGLYSLCTLYDIRYLIIPKLRLIAQMYCQLH